jgi:hypothetical protein
VKKITKPPGPIKDGEVLDQLSDSQILKKNSIRKIISLYSQLPAFVLYDVLLCHNLLLIPISKIITLIF